MKPASMTDIAQADNRPAQDNPTEREVVTPTERVEWVDFAKAICIVAVVAMYATHHIQQATNSTGWMQLVVNFAQPFRMPDFFLIAGLFVSRVLHRPWRSYIDSKVLYFFYFYAVWASFRFAVTHFSGLSSGDWLPLAPAYLKLYIAPPSGPLWFIYVLALFFIAVRMLRAVPSWIVFMCAAAIQVLHLDTGITFLDKFTWYFIFFYTGYVLAPEVFRLAAWAQARPGLSVTILGFWFVGNALLVKYGMAQLSGMSLLLGFAGAFAVMLVATLLARAPGMHWFSYLGKNSIVVYLAFVIPLGGMRWLVGKSYLPADVGTLSFLAAVISVSGAIVMFWTLRHTPLRFMFVRPAWSHLGSTPPGSLKSRGAGTRPA